MKVLWPFINMTMAFGGTEKTLKIVYNIIFFPIHMNGDESFKMESF